MTSLRYEEKVALITGGSRGIGKGCVDVFVENGAKVVFCSNDEVITTCVLRIVKAPSVSPEKMTTKSNGSSIEINKLVEKVTQNLQFLKDTFTVL
ncbi:unnamed protein product [Mytilus coruscus]|uniref:Uncharacterized protein n=1 Tax=Mytilus coruscus TaxID=42192 RepID=A0A6J8A8N3_MYTCO|nr:unnamed protein product [Mytilus coruscus]